MENRISGQAPENPELDRDARELIEEAERMHAEREGLMSRLRTLAIASPNLWLDMRAEMVPILEANLLAELDRLASDAATKRKN